VNPGTTLLELEMRLESDTDTPQTELRCDGAVELNHNVIVIRVILPIRANLSACIALDYLRVELKRKTLSMM
jgi:hypothetical protein